MQGLSNILRDLHAAVESDYMRLDELTRWAEQFFYHDYQPKMWVIELLSSKTKMQATAAIIDDKWSHNIHSKNYEFAYAGFSFLNLERLPKHERRKKFPAFIYDLIDELDGADYLDSVIIPSQYEDINARDWVDVRKYGCLCRKNYGYLLSDNLYKF